MFGEEVEIYPRWKNLRIEEMKPLKVNIYPFECIITLIGLEGFIHRPKDIIPVEVEIATVQIKIEVLGFGFQYVPEMKLEYLQRLEKDKYLEKWIVSNFNSTLHKEAMKRVQKYGE